MERDDQDLDVFFQAARKAAPTPSDDLMARVLADSTAQQPDVVGLPVAGTADAVGPGLLGRLFEGLGGWPALAGLTACLVLGVGIGINPPGSLEDLTSYYFSEQGDAVMGLFWSYGDLVTETGA